MVLGLILGALVLLALASLCRVPPGHSYTINRLGRFHRTLAPGIHFIVPGIDRITHRISMLGQVLGVECTTLQTADECPVQARGTLYFQILDPRKASGRIHTLEEAAQSLTESTTREMVQQMTLDTLHHRSTREINAWLLGLLNQASNQWGVRITRVDLDFTEAGTDAGEQP